MEQMWCQGVTATEIATSLTNQFGTRRTRSADSSSVHPMARGHHLVLDGAQPLVWRQGEGGHAAD
jgi:hypothetical protein